MLNNSWTDIDDLILNTLGTVIGFAMFKLWMKCRKTTSQPGNAPVIELPIYILGIFAGRFLLFNEMGLAKLLYGFYGSVRVCRKKFLIVTVFVFDHADSWLLCFISCYLRSKCAAAG